MTDPAQAIEARRAETGTGSVADESAVRQDAPKCATCGATNPADNWFCSNGFHAPKGGEE